VGTKGEQNKTKAENAHRKQGHGSRRQTTGNMDWEWKKTVGTRQRNSRGEHDNLHYIHTWKYHNEILYFVQLTHANKSKF
jgi:hypothetical protein